MSKYYDAQLIYNQQRHIDCTESNEVFESFLVHNFYTYTCMEKMLTEYEERIKALETNEIELIKATYKQYFMEHYRVTARMKYTDDLYIKECKVIREFYANFISHMRTMMKNNPQTDLISVKGS